MESAYRRDLSALGGTAEKRAALGECARASTGGRPAGLRYPVFLCRGRSRAVSRLDQQPIKAGITRDIQAPQEIGPSSLFPDHSCS